MNKYGSFTGGVLKALFKKPATYGYPYNKKEFPDRTRGSIVIDIDNCIFCGLCEKKCPSSAIKVDRNLGTWSIDRMGCVQCENCVNGCPKKVLSTNVNYTEPNTKKTVDVFKNEKIAKAGADDIKAKNAAKLSPYDVNDLPCADVNSCIFCGVCEKLCPQGAITVDRDTKTWKVDEEKCIHCGICYYKCPRKCIKMVDAASVPAPAESGAQDGPMLPKADLDKCVYCTLCAKKCPANALTVDRAEKIWQVDADTCVSCGACADGCPKKCIEMTASAAPKATPKPAKKAAPTHFENGYDESAVPACDTEACVFCGLCEKACPQEAIKVDRATNSWTIDESKCIHCAICAYKCPKKCIDMK